MSITITQEKRCEERVWSADVGDGYSGYETCGGTYEKIGKADLYQCNSCKKVIEKP